MGQVLLPEQTVTFTTSNGFVLSIDPFQNAIKSISHPTLDWRKHEQEILAEVNRERPGIQIWKTWTVTLSSSSGTRETIEVSGLKTDLPEMFPGFISAEEHA